MNEAHNKSLILRTNKWLRCNDTSIRIERWPRGGKDVYVIVMQIKSFRQVNILLR